MLSAFLARAFRTSPPLGPLPPGRLHEIREITIALCPRYQCPCASHTHRDAYQGYEPGTVVITIEWDNEFRGWFPPVPTHGAVGVYISHCSKRPHNTIFYNIN